MYAKTDRAATSSRGFSVQLPFFSTLKIWNPDRCKKVQGSHQIFSPSHTEVRTWFGTLPLAQPSLLGIAPRFHHALPARSQGKSAALRARIIPSVLLDHPHNHHDIPTKLALCWALESLSKEVFRLHYRDRASASRALGWCKTIQIWNNCSMDKYLDLLQVLHSVLDFLGQGLKVTWRLSYQPIQLVLQSE